MIFVPIAKKRIKRYIPSMPDSQVDVEVYTRAVELLQEIYTRQSSTLTILRRARLVAKMVEIEEVVEWIDKEISGYSSNDQLPPYRIVEAVLSYTYSRSLPTDYYTANKGKLTSSTFEAYNLYMGVPKIESCLAEGSAVFIGNQIASPGGVAVYETHTISKKNLSELLDRIQEKTTKELETIVATSLKKQPLNTLPTNQIDIKDTLRRFNDYKKYDKDPIKDEDGVRADVYKILKPMYPDLVDEEYLSRFGVKNPKPDFAIPSIKIFIENKFVPSKKELPRIQEEILADIPSYLKNNKDKFDGILVFVYSRDHVPTDFIKAIKDQEGIIDVIVAYAPAVI